MADPPDQSQDEVNPSQYSDETLDLNTAVTVSTLAWSGARPGKCYQNVNRFVMERGGGFAGGWALADSGPIVRNDAGAKPLYYRWIHHFVWEDSDRRLWEVTPCYHVHNHDEIAWAPTSFILDRKAIPRIRSDGFCVMQPARYMEARAEGLNIAKCLNALERDGSLYETYWLQQAMQALKRVGFGTVEWHVERIDGRINNAWLFVD